MVVKALRENSEPLYAKASHAVLSFIQAQKLKPGEKLPPEINLAELLGVSRSTIREGLRELELQRRIARIHGRGTIVAHSLPAVTGLATLESLESIGARQGWRCGTLNLRIDTVRLPKQAAEALGRPKGERATRVVFVKTHDEKPVWLAESWVPVSVLSLEEIRSRFRNTLFDLFGPALPEADYAYSTVSATAATTRDAKLLHISRRTPLVVLTEVFYHAPEKPLFYSRNMLIPGEIVLQIMRRPPIDRTSHSSGPVATKSRNELKNNDLEQRKSHVG